MLVISTVNPQHYYFFGTYARKIEIHTSDPGALVEHGAGCLEALDWVCITNYVDLVSFS